MAKKYYVVWKGEKPGIYDTWAECERSIAGFKGAKFKSFKTLEQAKAAFELGYEKFFENPSLTYNFFDQKPIEDSIAVDAAYSSATHILEYQGVWVKNRKRIFYKKLIGGTNNIGEFLAIVHALALMKQKNKIVPLYTDSLTAYNWVMKKKVATTLEQTPENKQLFQIIDRAVNWLKNNNLSQFKILKWDTEKWGEIPADFGNK